MAPAAVDSPESCRTWEKKHGEGPGGHWHVAHLLARLLLPLGCQGGLTGHGYSNERGGRSFGTANLRGEARGEPREEAIEAGSHPECFEELVEAGAELEVAEFVVGVEAAG